jgi:sporulation protein YlmC with PRC-barrel domain
VIGEVKDITIKDNGSITAMQVNFNRLRLGPEVFVSYRDSNARPSTDGYMLGFSAEQISGLYPTFLSNIESASGGEDDVYSVKKLLGTQVTRQDGRKLGVVNDVLFAANGGRVEALLISIQANNLRGREVAIPINMTSVENNNFGRSVVISDDQADALIDYADDHR